MSRYSPGAKTRIKPSNSGSSGIRDTHGRQTVVHPVRYDLIPGHAEINRSMYYARVWLNSDRDHGDMDGFDALTMKRCYKEAWSIDKAVGMIEEERGKQFNPEVVDAFIGCLDQIRSIRQQLPE